MKIKKILDIQRMKKLVALVTVFAFLCSQTGFAQMMIVIDGNTETEMEIGPTTDIYTNTSSGKTGFNSFQKFDVNQAYTVNMHLRNKADTKSYENLVNMVTGNEMSRIDGTLNAFKNGKIGGNVFFLNPNGIMIGATGVVNVGALTLATPSSDYINRILADRDAFAGSFNGDTFSQAVIAGDVPINASGRISVKGRINAYYGAALHGGEVEMNQNGSSLGVTPHIKTLKASDILNLDDVLDMEIVALGGRILVTAKNIDIGDGAVITSKKNEGDTLADVHILATDKGENLIASRNATVTIGESLIEGKNVTVEAQAENKYDFDKIKTDQLEDLEPFIEELKGYYNDPSALADIDLSNIDFKEVLSVDYLLSLFDINDLFQGIAILTDGAVNGGLAKSDINAKVTIGGGAVINADENLDVKSSAFSQTTMKMSADGVSAAIGWNESLSKISINAASLFAGKDVSVTAKNEILSDISSVTGAYDIGNISGNAVTSLSFIDSETSVNINKDAVINAGQNVQVNAITEKNISITADAPKTDNASNIGIAEIYNNSDTKNSIFIDGTITAAEDIKIASSIVSNSKEQTAVSSLKAREEALTARNAANEAEKKAVVSEETLRQAKEAEEKAEAELETARQKLDELTNNNAPQEEIDAASTAVTAAEQAHSQAAGVSGAAKTEADSLRSAADTAKADAVGKEDAAALANKELAIAAAVIYDDSTDASTVTVGENASLNAGKNVDIRSDIAVNSEIAAKTGSTKIGGFSGNAVTALSFSDVSTNINIESGASIKASENVNIAAKTEKNDLITADAPLADTASNAGFAVIYNDSSVDSKVSVNSDITDIGGDIKIVSETDSKNTLTTAIASIQAQERADEAFKNASTALTEAAIAEENLKQAKDDLIKNEASLTKAAETAAASKTALEEIQGTGTAEEIAAAERKFAVADDARQQAESAKDQASVSVKQAEAGLGQAKALAEYAKTVSDEAQAAADKANKELAIAGTVVYDKNSDKSSVNISEDVNLKASGNISVDAKAKQKSDITAKTGSLDFGGITGNAVTAFSINKTRSNVTLGKGSDLEAGKDVNVSAFSGKETKISADAPATEETLNIGIAAIYNDSETDSSVLLDGNIKAGENVNIEAKNEVKRTESSAALVLQAEGSVKEAEKNAKAAEEKSTQSAKTATEAAKAATEAAATMKADAKEAENSAASLKDFMADYDDITSVADFLEKYEYLKEVLAFEDATSQQINSAVNDLGTAISNMRTEIQSVYPEVSPLHFDTADLYIQTAKQSAIGANTASDTSKEAAKNAGIDKAVAEQAKTLVANAKERAAAVNKKLAVTAGVIYDKSRETSSVSRQGTDAVNINAGKKLSIASVNSSSTDMTGKGTSFGVSINDSYVKTGTALNNVNLTSDGTGNGDGINVSAVSSVSNNVLSQSDSFVADTDINLGATVSLILSENDTSVDVSGGSINSAKDVNVKAQTTQNASSVADADTSLGLSVAFMTSDNKNAVNIDTDINAGGDLNARSVIDIQKKETKALIDSRMVESGGVERVDIEEDEMPDAGKENETADVNSKLTDSAQKAMNKGTSTFEGQQEGTNSGAGKVSEDEEVLGMIEDLSLAGAVVYAENKDNAEINIGKNSAVNLEAGNDINIGAAIVKINEKTSAEEKASISSVADSAGVAVTVSKSTLDSSVNLGNAIVNAGNDVNIESDIKVNYTAKADAGRLIFGDTFEGGAAVTVSGIKTNTSVDTEGASKIKAANNAKVSAVTEKDITVSADANAGKDSNVAISVVVSDSDSANNISLAGDIEAGKDVIIESKIVTSKNEISAKAAAGVEAAKASEEALRQARYEVEWAEAEVLAYELIEQEAKEELETAKTSGVEADIKAAEAKVKLAEESLKTAKKSLETKKSDETKLSKRVKTVDQTAIAGSVIYADNTENSNISVGNINITAGSDITINSAIDKNASVISDSEGVSVAIANNKTKSKVDLNNANLITNGKDSGKVSIISDSKIKSDMSSSAGTFNIGSFEGSAAVAISDVNSDTGVNISQGTQITDAGYINDESVNVKEAGVEIKAKTEKDISVISKASVSDDSEKTTVGLGLSLATATSKNTVNIAGDIKAGGDVSISSVIDTKNNTAQSTALRAKETDSEETDNKGNTKGDRESASESTAQQAMEAADKQINDEMDSPSGDASLPTVTVNKELKKGVSIAGTVVYAENEEISNVNITGTSLKNVELEGKNIEITSSLTNNAVGKTEASGIAVTVTDNQSESNVNMTDVTVNAANDAKIKAETVINAVSEALSGSLILGGSFEGGAATVIATINSGTSVNLSDNTAVSAGNDVKIEALTKKTITETADASTGNTSNVGVGVVYSETYSENTVTINGDISADAGSVEIISDIETVKNDITAKASVGEVTKKEEALRDAKQALASEEKKLEKKQKEMQDFERIVESIKDIKGFSDAYNKAKDLIKEAIDKKDPDVLVKAYEEIEKARGYLQGPVEELAAADWQKLTDTFDTLKSLMEAAAANPNEETLKALYDAFDPSKVVLEGIADDVKNVVDIAANKSRENLAEDEKKIKEEIEAKKVLVAAAQADYDALADRDLAIAGAVIYADDKDVSKIVIGKTDNSQLNINAGKSVSVQSQINKNAKLLGEADGISVVMVNNKSDADATLNNVRITSLGTEEGSGVKIGAGAKVNSDVKADTGSFNIKKFEGSAGAALAGTETNVFVDLVNGTDISSANDAEVSARTEKSTSVEVESRPGADANIGLGFALNKTKSKNDVKLYSDISAGGHINVGSVIESAKNDTKVHASSGNMSETEKKLEAGGAVIYASQKDEASIEADGITLEAGKDLNVTMLNSTNASAVTDGAGASAAILENTADSTLDIINSKLNSGSNINIASDMKVKSLTDAKSGTLTISKFEGGAATAVSTVKNSNNVNLTNIEIEAAKDAEVKAVTEKDISVSAVAKTGKTSNMGVGVAYSSGESDNDVYIKGKISAENINALSEINSTKNNVKAFASTGEGASEPSQNKGGTADKAAAAKSDEIDKAVSETETNQNSGLQDEENGAKNKIVIGGAVGYTTQSNKARINVESSELGASDNIDVSAKVTNANINNDVEAAVKNSANFSGTGAVLYGRYDDVARAMVNNSSLDAGSEINVTSTHLVPFIGEDWVNEFKGKDLTDIEDLIKLGELAGKKVEEDLTGINNGLVNSWVRSFAVPGDEGETKVSAAGAVNLSFFDFTSEALVDKSQINQKTDSSFRTGNQSVNVSADSDTTFVNVGGIFGDSYKSPIGQGGAAVGVGGTYNQITYETNTKAAITGTDTKIYANDLSVRSGYTQNDITAGVAGGESSKFGFQGVFNWVDSENDVDAYIDGAQEVFVEKGGSGGTLNVSAGHDASLFNVAGSVSLSEKAAVGISAALNEISRHTNAYISNINSLRSGKTNIGALNDGIIHSYSVAAAVAKNKSTADKNPKQSETPESDSYVDTDSYQSGGTGDSGSFGLGISGSASINNVHGEANAYISNTNMEAEGDLSVKALENSSVVGASGGAALSLKSEGTGVAIAGAASINLVDNQARAYVSGSDITNKGKVSVEAGSISAIIAVAAGLAGSMAKNGAVVAGSATVNITNNEVSSYVENSDIVSESSMSLKASDNSKISSLAGGISFTQGSAAVGAAVGVNLINNTVSSYLNNTDAKITKDIAISSLNNAVIKTLGIAGAALASANIAVSVIVNNIGNRTESYIIGKKDSDGEIEAGSVTISSSDKSEIQGLAGDIAAAGKVGIGAAVGVNNIGNTVNAYISNAEISAENNVSLNASSQSEIDFMVASLAASEKVGVVGGVAVNNVDNTANSYIDKSNIDTKGSVGVLAANKDKIDLKSGSIGAGGTVGFAGNVGLNFVTNKAFAEIRNNSKINALGETSLDNGLSGVAVKANVEEKINVFNAAMGGGGTVAVSGGVTATEVKNVSSAKIVDSVINEKTSEADEKQGVYVTADNKTETSTYGGAVSLAGTVAAGVAADFETISNTVNASIENSKVNAKGDIEVKTTNKESYDALIVAGAGSGGVSVAANVAVVTVDSVNTALVSDSTLNSGRDISISAEDKVVLGDANGGILLGAAAGGLYVGVAGGMFASFISNSTSAKMVNSKADAGRSFSLSAKSSQKVKGNLPSVGGGIVGVGLSSALTVVDTETIALVDEGTSEIKAGEDVSISASNKLEVTKLLIGAAGGLVGVGAAVSVTNLNSNVAAGIGDGIKVNAGKDVKVNAENARDMDETVIAAGGGFVGVAGSVAVLNIGDNIKNNSDAKENTDSYSADFSRELSRSGDYNASNAGNGGLTTKYINDMSRFDTNADIVYGPTAIKNGTTAFIGNGASVVAGNDISVTANDKLNFNNIVGGISGGFVGLGAAVNIADLKTLANAYVGDGAVLKAQNNITVASDNNVDEVNMKTIIATGGFVAANAGVSILDVVNNSIAQIGNNVHILRAKDVSVLADSNANIETDLGRLTAGAVAVGATVSIVNKKGTTEASIGDNVVIKNIPLYEESYSKLMKKEDVNLNNVLYAEIGELDIDEETEAAIRQEMSSLGLDFDNPEDLKKVVYVFGTEYVEDTIITAVENINVKADSNSNITTNSLSGTGGAIAAHADVFITKVDETITSSMGKNINILSIGDVNVLTDGRINASAGFLGLSLAAINIGIAYAEIDINFNNNVKIGEVDKEIASNEFNLIADNVNAVAKQSASADVKADVLAVAAVDISGNAALTRIGGDVNTVVEKGNHIFANNIVVAADAVTKQKAKSSMFQGGVAAIGEGYAKSEAGINTKVELKDDLTIIANNSMSVKSDQNNIMFVEAESGKGGLLSIGGVRAVTKNDSSNNIIIGTQGSQKEINIAAKELNISAVTTVDQDSKTSLKNVSLLNGARANNSNTSDSVVNVNIYGKTDIIANNVYIEALNNYYKNKDGAVVNTRSEGLSGFNFFDSSSRTDIRNNTKINFGSETEITTYKKNNLSSFIIDAANNVLAADIAQYKSFSLADGSAIENILNNTSSSEINFNGKIRAASNLKANARNDQDLKTMLNANILTGGVLFRGNTRSNSSLSNIINVNSGADLFAGKSLYLNIGQDHNNMPSINYTAAYSDVYLTALIPLDSSVARVTSNTVDKVNISENAAVKAAETVDIGSWNKRIYGDGDLYIYKKWLYFISDDDHKKSTNRTYNSSIEVNGDLFAGYNNNIFVNIEGIYGTPDFNISSEGSREGIGYEILEKEFENELYDALKAINEQLKDYIGHEETRLELEAERARILHQMEVLGISTDLGDGVFMEDTYDVDVIEFDDIHIGVGDIRIRMDNFYGTGNIGAADAPQILINNNSSLFLEFNDVIISNDNDASGKIYMNDVVLYNTAEIKKFNTNSSLAVDFNEFSYGIGNTESRVIINSYHSNLDLSPDYALKPAVTINGTAQNDNGLFAVVADGDIYMYGSVEAEDLHIESKNGNVTLSYWSDGGQGSVTNLSDPVSFWKSIASFYEGMYTGEPTYVIDEAKVKKSLFRSIYEKCKDDPSSPMYQWFLTYYGKRIDAPTEAYENSNDPVDDITNSTVIANNIFISGRYLDINSRVQAGRSDYYLTIDDNDLSLKLGKGASGSDLTGSITEAWGYYNDSSSGKFKNSKFELADVHGNMTAYYDLLTGEITMDSLNIKSGGKLEVYGHILNTSSSSGELIALDGYSRVNIDNNSDYKLNIGNINTSEKAAGQIKITDLARLEGANGKPLETIYKIYGNNIVKTDNTTVDAEGNGNHIEYIDGRDSLYLTKENQRYNWATGNSATELSKYEKVKTYSSFLGWDWLQESVSESIIGFTLIGVTVHDRLELSNPEYITYGDDTSPLYSFEYKKEYTGVPRTVVNTPSKKEKWTGFLNLTRKIIITYKTDIYKSINNYYVHSIKADNSIKVGFIGYNDPQNLNIASKADIALMGTLNAGNSADAVIKSQKAIDNTAFGNIVARNIYIEANEGIGKTNAVNMSLKGGTLSAVNNNAGDINVRVKNGVENYDTKIKIVENKGDGTIKIISDNNIVASDENTKVKGASVDLVSNIGGISGYDNGSLTIETDLINASAQEDIKLIKKSDGDLNVGKIESFRSDVKLEVENGGIFSNKVVLAGSRSEEQYKAIWESLGLISEAGWTEDELLYTLKRASVPEDANISGNNVYIMANGSIGSDIERFSFKASEFNSLSDKQKEVVMSAGAVDSVFVEESDSDYIVTVSFRDDLNVYAKNGMQLKSGEYIFLGGNKDINIVSAVAPGEINIRGKEGIYNTADDHQINLKGSAIRLESLDENIGTLEKAVCVETPGEFSARARKDINIHSHADLLLDIIQAGQKLLLVVEGDLTNSGSKDTVTAHSINIKAGNIGTETENLNIVLKNNSDYDEDSVVNMESSDSIYVNNVAKQTAEDDGAVYIGTIKAGDNVIFNSENGDIIGRYEDSSVISAKNISVNAENGTIGSADNKIRVADFDIVSATAGKDINVRSGEAVDNNYGDFTAGDNINVDVYGGDMNVLGKVKADKDIAIDVSKGNMYVENTITSENASIYTEVKGNISDSGNSSEEGFYAGNIDLTTVDGTIGSAENSIRVGISGSSEDVRVNASGNNGAYLESNDTVVAAQIKSALGDVKVETEKSVKAEKQSDNAPNFTGRNITIHAKDKIGEKDNRILTRTLRQKGRVNLSAANGIFLEQLGNNIFYSDYVINIVGGEVYLLLPDNHASIVVLETANRDLLKIDFFDSKYYKNVRIGYNDIKKLTIHPVAVQKNDEEEDPEANHELLRGFSENIKLHPELMNIPFTPFTMPGMLPVSKNSEGGNMVAKAEL